RLSSEPVPTRRSSDLPLLGRRPVRHERRPENREAAAVHELGRLGARHLLVEDDHLDDRRAAPAELARPVHADVARRVHRLLPGAEPSDLVAVGSRGRERTPAEIVGQVGLEPVPNLFAKRLFLLAEVEVHGRLTTSSPRLGLRGPSPATSCGSHYHVITSPRTAGPHPRDVLRLALPHHVSTIDHAPLTLDIPRLVLGV